MSNPEVSIYKIKSTLFEIYKNKLRLVNPLPEDKNDSIYNEAIERLERVFASIIKPESHEIVKGGNKRKTRKQKKY